MRDAGKVGEDTKGLTPSVVEKCTWLHPLSVLRHVAGRAVSLGKKKGPLADSSKRSVPSSDRQSAGHIRARLALGGNTCWADTMQVGKTWCGASL